MSIVFPPALVSAPPSFGSLQRREECAPSSACAHGAERRDGFEALKSRLGAALSLTGQAAAFAACTAFASVFWMPLTYMPLAAYSESPELAVTLLAGGWLGAVVSGGAVWAELMDGI